MLLPRKWPGWPPSALRLPQKFLFLLFLSGLLTLCFGALFLLPDSSRVKRLFMPRHGGAELEAPRSPPPGAGLARHLPANASPPAPPPPPSRRLRDPAELPPGAHSDPASRRTLPPGEQSASAPPLQQTRAPFRFDYAAFRRRLRHPLLGGSRSGTEEPDTRARRLKIKEVSRDGSPARGPVRGSSAPSWGVRPPLAQPAAPLSGKFQARLVRRSPALQSPPLRLASVIWGKPWARWCVEQSATGCTQHLCACVCMNAFEGV
ncbi:mannosyl-oligosaccharide -C2-alpha-mannosidase IC-like [Crotalus adamanteus]|uniref:Mannosyl-oligosaccharide -C2-alpha-mannosidase IC-like n=1 Tax=Crotalus adamanteus TaxID=8729 RepID=A0AAW1AYD7_CROAD